MREKMVSQNVWAQTGPVINLSHPALVEHLQPAPPPPPTPQLSLTEQYPKVHPNVCVTYQEGAKTFR